MHNMIHILPANTQFKYKKKLNKVQHLSKPGDFLEIKDGCHYPSLVTQQDTLLAGNQSKYHHAYVYT